MKENDTRAADYIYIILTDKYVEPAQKYTVLQKYTTQVPSKILTVVVRF